MAIPSRQIGWGTEENLLWQISKQLEYLIGVDQLSRIFNGTADELLAANGSVVTAGENIIIADGVISSVGGSSGPTVYSPIKISSVGVLNFPNSSLGITYSGGPQIHTDYEYLLYSDNVYSNNSSTTFTTYWGPNIQFNGSQAGPGTNATAVTIEGFNAGQLLFSAMNTVQTLSLPDTDSAYFIGIPDCSTITTINLPKLRKLENLMFSELPNLTSLNAPLFEEGRFTIFGSNGLTAIDSTVFPSFTKLLGSMMIYYSNTGITINLPSLTDATYGSIDWSSSYITSITLENLVAMPSQVYGGGIGGEIKIGKVGTTKTYFNNPNYILFWSFSNTGSMTLTSIEYVVDLWLSLDGTNGTTLLTDAYLILPYNAQQPIMYDSPIIPKINQLGTRGAGGIIIQYYYVDDQGNVIQTSV